MATTSPLMARVGSLLMPSSQKRTARVISTLTTMSRGPSGTTWVSVWLSQQRSWEQPFKFNSDSLCGKVEKVSPRVRTWNRQSGADEGEDDEAQCVTVSRQMPDHHLSQVWVSSSLHPLQARTFSRLLPMSLGTSWACSTPASRGPSCPLTTPSRTRWGWARMTSKASSICTALTLDSCRHRRPHLRLRRTQKPTRSSPMWAERSRMKCGVGSSKRAGTLVSYLLSSLMPARRTLTPSPWSGESCSSLSRATFGGSGTAIWRAVTRRWRPVTGGGFPATSMPPLKTRREIFGSFKVSRTAWPHAG